MAQDSKIKKLKTVGMKQLQSRQFVAAKKTFLDIYKRNNKDIDAIMNLGVSYAELNDYLKANSYFKSANNLLPNNAMILTSLGRSSLMLGDFAEATNSLNNAFQIDRNNMQVKHLLVNAYISSGDSINAVNVLTSILKLDPTDYDSTVQLGDQYFELSQFDKAKNQYHKAINISEDKAMAYTHMANILAQEGEPNKAEEFLNKSLSIDSQDKQAITTQAMIARYKGEYEKAYEILSRQVNDGDISLPLLVHFSAIATATNNIQEAIDLIENNMDKLSLGNIQKRQLYFSLGKLYDKKSNYDRAFKNYHTANRLKSTSFNTEVFEQEVDSIIKVFTKEVVQAYAGVNNPSSKPIFIVGMPRSGSTLIEQILSSYDKIDSAGEIDHIDHIYTRITGTNSLLAYTGILHAANAKVASECTNNYIRDIEELIGNMTATKIIDKGLMNFLHLGLIQLLFPNAKVIHCVRNPIDTCLSCYFQDFLGSHQYSFDLVHLGSYYNTYKKLMQHWKEVLTIPVYNICYEDMVADPEKNSKNLVQFLEIEWDEKCLNFYESQRFVVTSSSEQVRKPIHSNSVYRYKNYEEHIQPLIEMLDNPVAKASLDLINRD